jgi:hypothetical protein
MVWLIITTVILVAIFGAHAYATDTGELTNKYERSSKPMIYLSDRPTMLPRTAASDEPWDPFRSLFENLKEGPGENSKDKVITKLLLPHSSVEPSGYGLYSYLLFGSSSEAGRNKRYATARAYCKNFPELSEAIEVGIAPINLNIFSVPTKDIAPKDTYCRDAETLVDDYYDYARAQKLMRDIGLSDNGIYLVACDAPIARGCNPKTMFVVKLTTVKATLAELCVLEFRIQARNKNTWNDTTLRSLAYQIRTRLPDIERFISIGEAAAKGRPIN